MSDDILKLPVGDASRRPMQQGTAPRIELEVGRVPPQALEAEKAVLGATLLSREAVSTAIPLLREESFYHPAHRKIWKVIVDLFGRSSPVDVVTVGEELKNREELKTVGGLEYLVSLDRFVTTTAHADQYCRLVNEKAVLRKLIQVGDMIVARAYEQREEAPNQVDHAEEEIFKIATEQLRLRTGFNQMHQLVLQAYSTIEEYRERKVHVTGVPSGFSDLDEMTAGFQKSDLIVIAGRPSMGKTSFALNIAENVAVHSKKPFRHSVGIFSLEMSKEALVQRLLCSLAKVDTHKIRRGFASNQEYKALQDAAARLHDSHIFIDDSPSLGILEMRAKARRLAAMSSDVPLGLIIIDYLQMVRGPESSENRQQEISSISRSLKGLAKELQVPVIALSQLSRAVETRGGSKRPMLSDLRDSGAIEQDADVVLFVYRPEVYETDPMKRDGKAEILLSKQRNGPIGSVDLYFQSECTRFDSVSSRLPEPKF